MGNAAESGRLIGSAEDANIIKSESERNFALLLLKKNPRLQIIREPTFFHGMSEDGKPIGTIPDFLIINPNNPLAQGGIYVEITREKRNGTDPKAKQRRVMDQVVPKVRYVVLYGEHLQNVQKVHREFSLITDNNGRNGKNSHKAVVFRQK